MTKLNWIILSAISIIVGISIGHSANWKVLTLGSSIIIPPDGVDFSSMESLKLSIDLFRPKHYVFPFLAHAVGSLVGGLLTTLIAPKFKLQFALGLGIYFLLEGLYDIFQIPAPTWFDMLDLTLAYLPMSYIGGLMATKLLKGKG